LLNQQSSDAWLMCCRWIASIDSSSRYLMIRWAELGQIPQSDGSSLLVTEVQVNPKTETSPGVVTRVLPHCHILCDINVSCSYFYLA